jgi:hypothetical protein
MAVISVPTGSVHFLVTISGGLHYKFLSYCSLMDLKGQCLVGFDIHYSAADAPHCSSIASAEDEYGRVQLGGWRVTVHVGSVASLATELKASGILDERETLFWAVATSTTTLPVSLARLF